MEGPAVYFLPTSLACLPPNRRLAVGVRSGRGIRRRPSQAIHALAGIDQRLYLPSRKIDHRYLFGPGAGYISNLAGPGEHLDRILGNIDRVHYLQSGEINRHQLVGLGERDQQKTAIRIVAMFRSPPPAKAPKS